MKPSYLFFVLNFLLMPNQYFPNCSPKSVLCDYAPSLDPRKRTDKQMTDNYMSAPYYKKTFEDSSEDGHEPLPVKVHYEPTVEEKYLNGKEVEAKQEVIRRETEKIKLAGSKCNFKKTSKHGKAPEKVVKLEFAKDDFRCCPPVKKESVLCAECEQCELQVKANGDGVLLKCKDCKEVPPDEIVFLAGNNRRIIRLP